MSDYLVAVSKYNHDVNETDPNSFIFNSLYNTFKIIKTGTHTIELSSGTGQIFKKVHHLPFVPLVTGFAKESGYDHVFLPNSSNVYMYGTKAGLFTTGVSFVSIGADNKDLIFEFDSSAIRTVTIRYFCLETI